MTLDSAGLGLRVAQARQRAGLTQDALARSVGMERSALAKIETDGRRLTALELAQIAEAVGERIEWFVAEAPPAIVSYRNMVDPGEPSPRIDTAIERAVRAVEFIAKHDAEFRDSLRELPVFPEPADREGAEGLTRQARELLDI